MKINKKVIILLLTFNSSLIISSIGKKSPIKKTPISISLNDQLQQKIADSETADREYSNAFNDLKLLKDSLVQYKLEEKGSKLEEDSSNEILFKAKLAALGKKSLGDETITTVKTFLENLSSFTELKKTFFYKYLTHQEYSSFLSVSSFGNKIPLKQREALKLFGNFSPVNRAKEIGLSKSPKNDTKIKLLEAWQEAEQVAKNAEQVAKNNAIKVQSLEKEIEELKKVVINAKEDAELKKSIMQEFMKEYKELNLKKIALDRFLKIEPDFVKNYTEADETKIEGFQKILAEISESIIDGKLLTEAQNAMTSNLSLIDPTDSFANHNLKLKNSKELAEIATRKAAEIANPQQIKPQTKNLRQEEQFKQLIQSNIEFNSDDPDQVAKLKELKKLANASTKDDQSFKAALNNFKLNRFYVFNKTYVDQLTTEQLTALKKLILQTYNQKITDLHTAAGIDLQKTLRQKLLAKLGFNEDEVIRYDKNVLKKAQEAVLKAAELANTTRAAETQRQERLAETQREQRADLR